MTVPYTFASQSGIVPATELDANFAACFPLSMTALTLAGNATNATANGTNLTAAQAYSILKTAIPTEVVGYMGGTQGGASWQILRYQPTTAFILSAASSLSSAGIAATGSTVFTIADNGSTIGTITFSASGTTGVIAITGSPYTVAIGHVLTVTAPVTPDATLANVNITLAGVRN